MRLPDGIPLRLTGTYEVRRARLDGERRSPAMVSATIPTERPRDPGSEVGEGGVRPDAAGRSEITERDYRRLHRQLFAQIRRTGVPATEVEDLIQETFLHAQRGLDRGQFDGRSDRDTWIVSIAKKRAFKYHRHHRANKRQAELVSLGDADELASGASVSTSFEPDPQVKAAHRQRLGRALEAIGSLPEGFRAPLVLSVRGHSYEEIAGLLDLPMSLVTSRIHQARGKVRKLLSRPRQDSPR